MALCGLNISLLEPGDVYCTQCVHIYSLLMHLCTVLSTASFVFTAYVVLAKSTQLMAKYKLYLLNCLCWGFLFSVLNGQAQVVTFGPVVASYMHGPLMALFHSDVMDINLLVFTEICLLNYIVGLMLLLLYRFVFFEPSSHFSLLGRALNSPYCLIAVMAVSTLLGGIGENLSGYGATLRSDSSKQDAFPRLKEFFSHFRVLGIVSDEDDYRALVLSTSIPSILIFIGLILANLLLHKKRSQNVQKLNANNNAQHTTLRLMTQLYRMNSVQIVLIGCFLTGPILIGIAVSAYRCRFSHHIWLLAMWLSSLHCSLDSLIILLYIRPYQQYLLRIMRKISRKSSVGTPQPAAVHVQQAATAPLPLPTMAHVKSATAQRVGTDGGVPRNGPRKSVMPAYLALESMRRNSEPFPKHLED